jgi:heat shock protein HtpX
MSKTLYQHSSVNKRKTWFLMTGFLILVIFLGWVFSYSMDSPFILYFAVIFSLVFSLISYWKSDKIVLKMSGAKEVKKKDAPELYRLVENLCITAGLPIPKVYVINDPAPNAFATGRNPENAVIAVTTGLLEKLEKSELEGVIAHELSHIGNYDILIGTIATIMVGIVVLLADLFIRWSIFGGQRRSSRNSDGKADLIITALAILLAILAPLFAYFLQFAISRKQEYKADVDAALLTRYPEGLARALEKISQHSQPVRKASRATAHMYISSPLKEKKNKKSWWSQAMATHPPIENRIARLRASDR